MLSTTFHAALSEMKDLENERRRREQEAFSIVGIWSDIGIEDTRKLFWNCYEQGKELAKRWTLIDVLFTVGRRDEELVVFLLRIALAFLSNLTVGLMSGLLIFMWQVWSLIVTYQASLVPRRRQMGMEGRRKQMLHIEEQDI